MQRLGRFVLCFTLVLAVATAAGGENLPGGPVEGQPLASNVGRVLQALEALGTPLPAKLTTDLASAIKAQDQVKLQNLLDQHVLIVVNINPESRVKALRGPAAAELQQTGYTPILLKVINEAGVTKPLHIGSPQAQPIYSQGPAGKIKDIDVKDRFLDV